MALLIGVVVSLVVLWAERHMDGVRTARRVRWAQLAAVEGMIGRLEIPFSLNQGTLKVDDDRIPRILGLLGAVPEGTPDFPTPGYSMLRWILSADEQIDLAAQDLTRLLDEKLDGVPPGVAIEVRGEISGRAGGERFHALVSENGSATVTPRGFLEEPDLAATIDRYTNARRALEGCRKGFNTADRTWRAKAHLIVNEQIAGAPHWYGLRVRRALLAKRRLAAASVEAQEVGEREVLGLGIAWFPPRPK